MRRSTCGGFSVGELLVVIALGGLLLTAASLPFLQILKKSRLDVAVHHVTTDLRKARSLAITTGWEYRIVGYGASGSSIYKNNYRIIGRRTTSETWPADTDAPFKTATRMAGDWVSLFEQAEGVLLNPSDTLGAAAFSVTFDSRGARSAMTGSVTPMELTSNQGETEQVEITTVGKVRVL